MIYFWICKADNGQGYFAEVHFRSGDYDMYDMGIEIRFSLKQLRTEYQLGARELLKRMKPNQVLEFSADELENIPADWSAADLDYQVETYAKG